MEAENWIERLIEEETSEEPAFFNESLEMEEATEEFLLELKGLFSEKVKQFNQCKTTGPSLYIYKLTNVREGFMLYRSGFRLLFYYEASGKVRIQLLKTTPGRTQKEILNAVLHAFRNNPLSVFKWSHEKHSGFVDSKALVSCYFQFLVRTSRSDRLKTSEKASLNEISSFL